MAVVRLNLGDHAYLFCNRGTEAPRLVISSHGEVARTLWGSERYFVTPKVLVFYTPLYDAMTDKSIEAIIRGAEPETERAGPNKSTQNYKLHKYQEHFGQGPETYDDLIRAVRTGDGGWDVVSVRNRNLRVSPTLDDILKLLANDYKSRFDAYQEVHCSFCRV